MDVNETRYEARTFRFKRCARKTCLNPVRIVITIAMALVSSDCLAQARTISGVRKLEDVEKLVERLDDKSKQKNSPPVLLAKIPRNKSGLTPIRIYGDTRLRHSDSITQIIELPKTNRIVTSSGDGTARVWDATTGKQLMRFNHKSKSDVWNVQLVDDSEQEILTCGNQFVSLWSLKTGKLVKSFEPRGRVLRLAMVPGKRQFVTAGPNRIAHLWDMESGKSIRQFKGHSDDIYGVAVSSDGKTLVTCGDDNQIYAFELETGKRKWIPNPHKDDVITVQFNADSTRLLSCSSDNRAICWDTKSWKKIWSKKFPNDLTILHWSPDGKLAGFTCDDGYLYLVNTETGDTQISIKTPSVESWAFAFVNGGKQVLAGGDFLVQRYDVASGKMVFPNYAKNNSDHVALGEVTSFQQDAKGNVWICAEDAHVRQFGIDGSLKRIVALHEEPEFKRVKSSDIDPDGTKALALFKDAFQVVDLGVTPKLTKGDLPFSSPKEKSRKREVNPFGTTPSPIGPRFSNDHRYLVFSPDSKKIKIMDRKSGRTKTAGDRSHSEIERLVFSHDRSRVLVSYEKSNTITIINSQNGKVFRQLHPTSFTDFNFSRSGTHAIYTYNKNITIFGPSTVLFKNLPSDKKLIGWLNDLNSGDFKTRSNAELNLAKSGKAGEKHFTAFEGKGPETRYRIRQIREAIIQAGLPNRRLGRLSLQRTIKDLCISDSGKRWAVITSDDGSEVVYGVVENDVLKPVARASDGQVAMKIRFGNQDNQILTSNIDGTVSLYEFQKK